MTSVFYDQLMSQADKRLVSLEEARKTAQKYWNHLINVKHSRASIVFLCFHVEGLGNDALYCRIDLF